MKICTSCKKKLSKENFRKINRSNWQGLYPQCKSCENTLMQARYINNPIPQMLSNAKIRAKQKGVDFNLTSKYLKKIFPKNNKCPITGLNFLFGFKNKENINKNTSIQELFTLLSDLNNNIEILECNSYDIAKTSFWTFYDTSEATSAGQSEKRVLIWTREGAIK
jgi:hypothetical protein